MEIPELREGDFNRDYATEKIGGEAIVYKGNYLLYGDVAVKKYRKAFCDDEIKILKENIHHPNIIRIIGILTDSSTSPRRIGYIMSYMRIGSLDEIIHNKNNKNYDDIYTNKQINSWIIKICCGLSYLHSRKIIHKDIKPSNILLGESYNDVQLSDFGIARSISSLTHRSLTTRCGTPVYMAPEMFKGQTYDFSVDVYSLSITIWEILHRRIPSDGERPELNNNLSKEVSDLLTRCWDTDASKRPTIDYVHEFCRETTFSLINLENSANECETLLTPNPIEQSFEQQTILLLGGRDGMCRASFTMLENNEQSWKRLDIQLPYPTFGHGAQFLNNSIYIFGGYDLSSKELNCTYKLSKSLKWEKMSNMNQKRYCISNSSVILNNQIWVCGGCNEKGKLKSVEMYDPETNKWKYMKEMSQSRADAAATVVNGKIFCFGGPGGISLDCYDPSSDVWEAIYGTISLFRSNVAQEIWEHGAVEMDGHFVVVGGCNYQRTLKNVWALDTTDKNANWIEKPSMSISPEGFSIAKIHDKIFVCGGLCINNENSVEIFEGGVWRDGPKMPSPRERAPAIVISMEFAEYLY